jgi:hypothetical protein
VEARAVARAVEPFLAYFAPRPAVPDGAGDDFRKLVLVIDAEPFEDGVTHSCEGLLESFLSQHGAAHLMTLVGRLSDTRAAIFLRLLGRVRGLDSKSRSALLAHGLASQNIELRDAAVQAAELWDDPTTLGVLRNHHEETPWLAEYIKQVVRSLQGES